MSTTPPETEKEQEVEQRQWESPWSVFSVNGVLFLLGLLMLAVLFYYTLWPRP